MGPERMLFGLGLWSGAPSVGLDLAWKIHTRGAPSPGQRPSACGDWRGDPIAHSAKDIDLGASGVGPLGGRTSARLCALGRRQLVRIASISKVAVALIQARLHEAGKLNWDADLSGLLTHPKFEKLPITPRLLLTHRSGLRDSDTWPQFHAQGLADVLKLTPTWSEHPPGAKFAYCNLGFVVLATAMERACGERFDAIAKRWLFDPLRMKARFHPSGLDAHSKAHLATLYRMRQGQWVAQVDAREGPWTTVPDIEPGLNAAAFHPKGACALGWKT